MSIELLMGNEKARAIFCDIDAHMPAAICADQYKLARLDGDEARALAFEVHIRQLAQLRFNDMDVLTALRDMEKDKSRRKMGKGGAGHFKRIARKIREKYASGDYERLPGVANSPDRVKFSIACAGSILNVICKDMPGSVEQVARKYDRGWRQPSWRRA